MMVWQWRVSLIDQLFHFLGCFGVPEPKGNGLRIPKCGIEECNVVCETMLFPVPISDRL